MKKPTRLPEGSPTLFNMVRTVMVRRMGTAAAPGRAAYGFKKIPTLTNPCLGCPLSDKIKVIPHQVKTQKVIAVGLAPGGTEEQTGIGFTGESGQILRAALRDAGLDDERDVGYANLGRCRPDHDDFNSPEWRTAEDHCWYHLSRDLLDWKGPLLLLGSGPVQRFFQNKKARVTSYRGLWQVLPDGRPVFCAKHPSAILRAGGRNPKAEARKEFDADIQRMADRLLGRETKIKLTVEVYQSLTATDAKARLRWLAEEFAGPLFFDLETMDAAGSPSRVDVATDPFHPDFRVRGAAVAWGPYEGAWFELAPMEAQKAKAKLLLDPVFGSDIEKGAFVGGFDENGLIVPGWVTMVRNRTRDPYLASIALDSTGIGHSLERLLVEVLREPQPKGKSDRSRIRDLPLRDVAEYAVADACGEYRLDQALQQRLDLGEYL